jgi:hypothetical protein
MSTEAASRALLRGSRRGVGERPRTNLKLRCVRTRVSCAIFRSSEDRVRSSAESRAASAPRHIVFLRSSQLPYAASTNRVLAEPTLRLRKMLLKAAQWAQLGCVQENLDAAATGGAAANTIRLFHRLQQHNSSASSCISCTMTQRTLCVFAWPWPSEHHRSSEA